jgi:DNA-directed RNA polymerase delta subunit
MAKIVEEIIVVKLSKLVKDGETVTNISNQEIDSALEQVIQELVGDGVIVEVERP